MATDLSALSSLVRNNRVADLEAALDSPECCVNVNAEDAQGNTLLCVAAQNGNKRIIKLLLRRGAAINHCNLRGNSPLHFLYAFGYKELGVYLVGKGADDSIRNHDGLTPYEGTTGESLKAL